MYRKTVVWKPWLFRKKNQGEMKKPVKSRKAHLDHVGDTIMAQENHACQRVFRLSYVVMHIMDESERIMDESSRFINEAEYFINESLFQHRQDDNSKKDHLF